MTIWDLKKVIGVHASKLRTSDGNFIFDQAVHPASIRLYRYAGAVDIKDIENGKTLAEMHFKGNEQLTAFKKNVYTSSKEPLLNEYGTDLSDKAKAIFTRWFMKYSMDDPENPGTRIMNPNLCAAFTRTCTDDYVGEEDNRVVGLFYLYDHDKDNKIVLKNFLQFYFESSSTKEEVVRSNLFIHQYKQDLTKLLKDSDPEFVLQKRKTVHEMPRHKLGNRPEYFHMLFRLLQEKQEVSQNTWQLIKIVAINYEIFQRVLKLDKEEGFAWEKVFDTSSIYQMLYTLQIVHSFLSEDTSSLDLSTEQGQLKKTWIERFLQQGGFIKILELFNTSTDTLCKKPAEQLNKFEKSFIELLLQIIKIFMMAACQQGNSDNMMDVMQMVKQTSEKVKQEGPAQDKDKENQAADQEAFTTPQKQIPADVQYGIQNKGQVTTIQADAEPIINQDTLFGQAEMFTNANAPADDKKKKDVAIAGDEGKEVEDYDLKRFAELVNVMKDTGLGEKILQKIDFKQL